MPSQRIKVKFTYGYGDITAYLSLTEDQLRLLKYLNDELIAFGDDGAEITEVEKTEYREV